MTRAAFAPSARTSPLVCLAVGLFSFRDLPVAASAQDWSTQERLDRLERDLNMLQRQVYRGAPTTASGGGRNERRLDQGSASRTSSSRCADLTGKVEEFSNQVTQLRQRLQVQVNSDTQVRENMG